MASGGARDTDVLVRLAAMFVGLVVGAGVLVGSAIARQPLGMPAFTALFLALTLFLWGLNRFAFRRLPLGGATLILFSAAVFGLLFLVGLFVATIAAPFLLSTAESIVPSLHLSDFAFYALALMAVAGAAGTAFSRNIIYSAWSLLFALLGVAGLYVFLGADFPAVAQVLIYIGGILVLILFAIMLTQQIGGDPALTNAHLALPAGGLLGLLTAGVLTYMAVAAPWKTVAEPSVESSAQQLGVAFLTDYLLPFEVVSVVLLAALVGAVVIARKEIKETSDTAFDV